MENAGKGSLELLMPFVVQRCAGTHGGEPKEKLIPRASDEAQETLAVESVRFDVSGAAW